MAVETIPPGLLVPHTHIEITALYTCSLTANYKAFQINASQGYQTIGTLGSGLYGPYLYYYNNATQGPTIVKSHIWVGANTNTFILSSVLTANGEGNNGPLPYWVTEQVYLNGAFGIDIAFSAALSNASDNLVLNAYDIEVKTQ